MSIRHAYATVNGIRLHYAESGDASRPLLLFAHGFPEFWYAWQAQLLAFAGTHHAVAPDMRGFNLSDKPAKVKDYRATEMVADLRQLITHLGHKDCVLVAHDWGGAAAWSLAAAHPELVRRLIIVNSPHPVSFARALKSHAAQQKASQYMLWLRAPQAEQLLAENNYARLARFLDDAAGRSVLTPEEMQLYRQAWTQPGALTASLNYYRASPLYPPSADDPGAAALDIDPAPFVVRVPTLVIWGERDWALLPVLLEDLGEFVPELSVVRLPEASHWVMHEMPDRVNELIRDFAA